MFISPSSLTLQCGLNRLETAGERWHRTRASNSLLFFGLFRGRLRWKCVESWPLSVVEAPLPLPALGVHKHSLAVHSEPADPSGNRQSHSVSDQGSNAQRVEERTQEVAQQEWELTYWIPTRRCNTPRFSTCICLAREIGHPPSLPARKIFSTCRNHFKQAQNSAVSQGQAGTHVIDISSHEFEESWKPQDPSEPSFWYDQ